MRRDEVKKRIKTIMKGALTRGLALAVSICLCLMLSPLAIVHAEGDAGDIQIDITKTPNPDVDTEITEDPNKDSSVEASAAPDYDDVTITAQINEKITKGIGTKNDPFLVQSPGHLIYMREQVKKGNNFEGKYIKLTTDIDLSELCGEGVGDWEPIGIWEQKDFDDHAFNGTFDGGGHTITGLYTQNGGDGTGFFGEIEHKATIKNLTIEGYVRGIYAVGGFVGNSEGIIENCCFRGTVIGTYDRTGSIAGLSGKSCAFINCSAEGKVEGHVGTGGIVGNTGGEVRSCTFKGDVSGQNAVGGVIGFARKNYVSYCKYEGGTVESTSYNTGGVVGLSNAKSITQCESWGTVNCGDQSGGGIVGGSASPIVNCKNYGDVHARRSSGGIAGKTFSCSGDKGTVSSCENHGNVSVNKYYAGGIVGYASHNITFCENYGEVSGPEDIGDICGYKTDSVIVMSSGKGVLNSVTGSIFGEGSIVMIIVLSAVSVAAIAGGVFFIKRRKKNATAIVSDDKEGLS